MNNDEFLPDALACFERAADIVLKPPRDIDQSSRVGKGVKRRAHAVRSFGICYVGKIAGKSCFSTAASAGDFIHSTHFPARINCQMGN